MDTGLVPLKKTVSQTSNTSTASSVESLESRKRKVASDFVFEKQIGEGSYSTVLLAKETTKNKYYAVKVLEKKHIIKENKVKYVTIEKDVLNSLNKHPLVVKLYYTFQDQSSLYFVLEYCPNGDLLSLLKEKGRFHFEASKYYGMQILSALQYIHSKGILHRDLKPENILLDKKFRIKITDFGSAKILDSNSSGENISQPEGQRRGSFVGTAEYCSPELLNDREATAASDIWAFGCIIYQMLVGFPPMKGSNEYQTFQKIINLKYHFPEELDPTSRALIKGILVLDYLKRPEIDALVVDPFFEGLSVVTIHEQKAPQIIYQEPLVCLPVISSLYMNPEAYFAAKGGTYPDEVSSIPDESLDSWVPDLSKTKINPNSLILSLAGTAERVFWVLTDASVGKWITFEY